MEDFVLRKRRYLGDLLSSSFGVMREFFGLFMNTALRKAGPFYLLYFALVAVAVYLMFDWFTSLQSTLASAAMSSNPAEVVGYILSGLTQSPIALICGLLAIVVSMIATSFFYTSIMSVANVVGSPPFEEDEDAVSEAVDASKWSLFVNYVLLAILMWVGTTVLVAVGVGLAVLVDWVVALFYGFAVFAGIVVFVIRYLLFFNQLIVIERLGLFAAFKRNAELTSGQLGKTFGYLIVMVLLLIGFSFVVGIGSLIITTVLGLVFDERLVTAISQITNTLLNLFVSFFSILFSTYWYGAYVAEVDDVEEVLWTDEDDAEFA